MDGYFVRPKESKCLKRDPVWACVEECEMPMTLLGTMWMEAEDPDVERYGPPEKVWSIRTYLNATEAMRRDKGG